MYTHTDTLKSHIYKYSNDLPQETKPTPLSLNHSYPTNLPLNPSHPKISAALVEKTEKHTTDQNNNKNDRSPL